MSYYASKIPAQHTAAGGGPQEWSVINDDDGDFDNNDNNGDSDNDGEREDGDNDDKLIMIIIIVSVMNNEYSLDE